MMVILREGGQYIIMQKKKVMAGFRKLGIDPAKDAELANRILREMDEAGDVADMVHLVTGEEQETELPEVKKSKKRKK